MWPFKRKPIVDADTAKWHADNFAWLVASFGGFATLAHAVLILPKPGYFPFDGEDGHARAVRIFESVKHYCGMDEWPLQLAADQEPAEPHVSAPPPPERGNTAAGMSPREGDTLHIPYEPALLEDPERLIATFALDLAHYLLMTAPSPLPCPDNEREALTDLTAVYLGFGVFMANSVFKFSVVDGHASLWRRSDCLPEQDFIFATALFIAAKELDPEPAYQCLKPHLAKMLKRALRDLATDKQLVEQIRNSIPAPAGEAEHPEQGDGS